jgi:hypothetical protein
MRELFACRQFFGGMFGAVFGVWGARLVPRRKPTVARYSFEYRPLMPIGSAERVTTCTYDAHGRATSMQDTMQPIKVYSYLADRSLPRTYFRKEEQA